VNSAEGFLFVVCLFNLFSGQMTSETLNIVLGPIIAINLWPWKYRFPAHHMKDDWNPMFGNISSTQRLWLKSKHAVSVHVLDLRDND